MKAPEGRHYYQIIFKIEDTQQNSCIRYKNNVAPPGLWQTWNAFAYHNIAPLGLHEILMTFRCSELPTFEKLPTFGYPLLLIFLLPFCWFLRVFFESTAIKQQEDSRRSRRNYEESSNKSGIIFIALKMIN